MENFLVPFNFQIFKTTEAVWDLSKKDYIKMFRMTRKGIGEFLNPESKDPQKIIDNIIARNLHFKELSVPLTVRATDGKNYQTDTYDIWGVYQISIESNLERAKEFLRRFPAFMEALFTRRIKPPAIGDVRPEILAYAGMPFKEKKQYREKVCTELGWDTHKFFRECERAKRAIGTPIAQERKQRADAGKTIYPALKEAALFIKAQMPTYGGKKIADIIGRPEFKTNINRWLIAA